MLSFIAKAASGTFLLRLFYLASGFITTLLLTRWLGAEGLGVYNFVISWIVLTVIFVKFGFEDYITREIAAFRGNEDYGSVKTVWTFTTKFILGSSLVAVMFYAVLIPLLSFENPDVTPTFWAALMMIPLMSFLGIYRGLFRGTKNIINSQLPEYLIRPFQTMVIVGALMLFSVPGKPEYAVVITVFGTLTALLFCVVRNPVRNVIRTAVKKPTSRAVWIAGAFPFLLIAGIHIFNQRTDRLMLGTLLDMKSVGIYSVAIQMSLVVNFPLLGITAAVAPLVAERQASNRQSELQSALIRTTVIATIMSVLIVGALAVLGPYVLQIFGPEFDAGFYPLLVLAAGQLANVAAGPAGAVLSMSRHERLVALGVFFSAVLNVILNWFLIPRYGVLGASIATAISMLAWNIMLVVLAKRILGINCNLGAFLIPRPSTTPAIGN